MAEATNGSPRAAVRVAMWSGPRNISTAMMRSWENRDDTVVVDEPLYAFYLKRTAIDHPMAERIVAQGECDWRRVVRSLLADLPPGKSVSFQKHMTLHLLPEVGREWLAEVTNCFLIRHPADVITSYVRKREDVDLDDLGFRQQTELYRWVCANTDQVPPILDARDIQDRPRELLAELCRRVGVELQESMLAWPPGPRPSDGIWAAHWYGSVEESTGFAPYREKSDRVPAELESVYEACLESYDELHRLRLRTPEEED